MPLRPGRFKYAHAALLQPVWLLLLLLLALLLVVPSHGFTPTPCSISTTGRTSARQGKPLFRTRTSTPCSRSHNGLVRCWDGIQPPSPPQTTSSPSKPLSVSSPTLPVGTWPPKGFRPFRSLREECGNVSLELDEDQQALVGPPPSQFFAGFRLRELDETNQGTFLKEAGRVRQG